MIVGNAEASKAIRSSRVNGLQILPCGYLPPNPAELLGSSMMKQIMEAVRSHYDWVLVDTPPILAMADAAVVCPTVEGVVMVVAGETATKPQVARAIEQVTGIGSKVLGVVLNKVNLRRNAYYYSQHYGEYYRSYYTEGGTYGQPESKGRKVAARDERAARRS
jgi:capsular exopolysaccharide synthesis family protein